MKRNTRKLTPRFCQGKTLVFFPSTQEEAKVIQEHLFTAGFGWLTNGQTPTHLQECVKMGICTNFNNIFYNPGKSTLEKGLLCDVSQFPNSTIPPGPKSVLTDLFNDISIASGALQNAAGVKRAEKRLREIQKKANDASVILQSLQKKNTKHPKK